MPDEVHPLRSFQAKLIWAHEHMNAFRQDISDFGRSEPCVIVHDFKCEGMKHTWRVVGNVDTPPQRISLRLGDTLNNFRGALDHVAWDLVLANDQTPTRFTAFPLCEEEPRFDSFNVRSQMLGIDESIQARIKSLQPYHRLGTHSTNYFLGLLNRLGNIEKHRHFNLIAASVDLAVFSVDDGHLSESFIYHGPIEDGTIFAVAKGKMDVNFISALGIAFGQGGEAAGEMVDELILRIELAVEDVFRKLAWFVLEK